MLLFKCSVCGADLNASDTSAIVKCKYCDSIQTIIPVISPESIAESATSCQERIDKAQELMQKIGKTVNDSGDEPDTKTLAESVENVLAHLGKGIAVGDFAEIFNKTRNRCRLYLEAVNLMDENTLDSLFSASKRFSETDNVMSAKKLSTICTARVRKMLENELFDKIEELGSDFDEAKFYEFGNFAEQLLGKYSMKVVPLEIAKANVLVSYADDTPFRLTSGKQHTVYYYKNRHAVIPAVFNKDIKTITAETFGYADQNCEGNPILSETVKLKPEDGKLSVIYFKANIFAGTFTVRHYAYK